MPSELEIQPKPTRFADLSRVAQSLSTQAGVTELCQEAVTLGLRKLGFDRLSIWLHGKDKARLYGTFGTDEHGQIRDEREQTYHIEEGLLDHESAAVPVTIKRGIELFDQSAQVIGVGDHASVLLWDGSRVLGILCADNLISKKPFEHEDREILLMFAMTLAILISRLEANEAKLKSDELFETIFEAAAVGIAIVDASGGWIAVNQAFAEIFGVTQKQALDLTWQDVTRTEDLAHCRDLLERTFAGEIEGYTLEKKFLKPGGGEFWALVRTKMVRDSGFMVGCLQDITSQKVAEAELENRVAARTHELKLAIENIESFSYSVSHDLRGPLRAINGFSNLVREDYGQRLDEDGRDYLARIERASSRMGELIDSLLNLSRIARTAVEASWVDISVLLEELCAEQVWTEFGGRFSVQPGMEGWGDRRLIQALYANLISNAVKFSAHRGELARVELGVVDGQFYVRDNGQGFDPALSSKLFQPFSRLHSEVEVQGSGIGLATVHRIIQRHGGHITACGEPGKGAEFRFTLPSPQS